MEADKCLSSKLDIRISGVNQCCFKILNLFIKRHSDRPSRALEETYYTYTDHNNVNDLHILLKSNF